MKIEYCYNPQSTFQWQVIIGGALSYEISFRREGQHLIRRIDENTL